MDDAPLEARFLTRAGLLAAGASLSAPALAHPSPELRWNMASAFQPSLEVIYGGAKTCAAAVSDMTDGNFAITHQRMAHVDDRLQGRPEQIRLPIVARFRHLDLPRRIDAGIESKNTRMRNPKSQETRP
jgi:hypothetical protein